MDLTSPHRLRLPEWQVSAWLNTPRALTLAALRGKVVLLHTFQMLCPGCVNHGLPQAERVRQMFPVSELVVIGLHTVFEHHAVMTIDALRAFVHEYRWSFPIGVDEPGPPGALPLTMARYGLQGTPTHLLIDRSGFLRVHHFGQMDDLALGAFLGQLLYEAPAADGAAEETAAAASAAPDAAAAAAGPEPAPR